MDGYLGPPGGHLQAGETLSDAAMRECKEEACIEPSAIRPLIVMPFLGGIDFIFEASEWTGRAEIGSRITGILSNHDEIHLVYLEIWYIMPRKK